MPRCRALSPGDGTPARHFFEMKVHLNHEAFIRYSGPAVALHWVVAALVVAAAGLGLYMADLPETAPGREPLFGVHRSLGVTVFALLVVRAAWRALHRPPELVSGMPRRQRIAAKATHVLLYVLLAAVPITGYLLTNFDAETVKVFGLALPPLVAPDKAAGRLFGDVHSFAAWTLLVLAGLHTLAALKHHFIDRDATLLRMLPGRRQ